MEMVDFKCYQHVNDNKHEIVNTLITLYTHSTSKPIEIYHSYTL